MPGLAHFCEHLLFMVCFEFDQYCAPRVSNIKPLRVQKSSPKKMNTLRYYVLPLDTMGPNFDLLSSVLSFYPRTMARQMLTLQHQIQTITLTSPHPPCLVLWSASRPFFTAPYLLLPAPRVNSMQWTQSTRRTIKLICGAFSN